MKIYNITNAKSLMEKISEVCTSKVELINEDGQHMDLTDGKLPADKLPLYYFKGTIKELELKFSNSDDIVAILYYLSNIGLAS